LCAVADPGFAKGTGTMAVRAYDWGLGAEPPAVPLRSQGAESYLSIFSAERLPTLGPSQVVVWSCLVNEMQM